MESINYPCGNKLWFLTRVHTCISIVCFLMSQAIIINKLAITICSTCITNGRVAQLSADHLSISSSPQVIAHSTPLGVETYLHPTLCRGGTSNQPQSIVGATYSHWVELVNIIVVVRARERLLYAYFVLYSARLLRICREQYILQR